MPTIVLARCLFESNWLRQHFVEEIAYVKDHDRSRRDQTLGI